MRVLLLSPYPEMLIPTLEEARDTFWCRHDNDEWPDNYDWVVSFGHRKIIPSRLIDPNPTRLINIHISLLPWNRGSDPNFWSWLDDTPKGVSIHRIDAGIDTGSILVQQERLKWRKGETLASSWHQLMNDAKDLFKSEWRNIRREALPSRRASGNGSYHKSADKEEIFQTLPLGWDTRCSDIKRLGKARRKLNETKDRNTRTRQYRQQAFKEF